jgi:ABC-type transporter Mla maintaining outer membrane lipid asymmetry permease subunit MlaE
VIKETYRDTVFYTPKAETNLTIPASELTFKQELNEVSKTKTYVSRNGNATAKATVSPQGVSIIATCDSLAMAAKIKSEYQKELSKQNNITESSEKSTTGYTLFNLITGFFVGVVVGCIGCFILTKVLP